MLQVKETFDSRKELIPVVEADNGLMVDSRALHRKLNVQTPHVDWIDRRVREYGFVQGVDFVSGSKSDFIANLRENLSTNDLRGRKSKAFLLTIDMAKELAMVERNKSGRMIRQYFIEIEKQYREWHGFTLPKLHCKKNLFEQGYYFNYMQLLQACGCSVTSGSVRRRIKRNPQEFFKDGNIFFVSDHYGRAIYANAFTKKLNAETAERRLSAASPKLIEGRV